MSEVRLSGVSKSFGAVRALDDVTLSVAEGELLTLLGPSGCGKTTLLRVVAGLEQPDGGRVHMGGEDITSRPTRERPIGMVFQSYALFPNLTVRQNVAFPLEVRRWSRDRVTARVNELLGLTRLEPEADRFPGQISGGQAQRCALARALAPHPGVLLLDEPLSALDVQVRGHLRDEIRRIQQQVGTTTIYVTHDQGEALAIADRVAVMNRGRIEQVGSPKDIYDAPATEFSARFVGSRNAIEVPVRDGRARLGDLFDVAAPADANGRVVSFITPEDLGVSGADQGGQLATVAAMSFLGPTTRLHLRLPAESGGVGLVADVSSRRAATLTVGQPVSLSVSPAAVRTFAKRPSE